MGNEENTGFTLLLKTMKTETIMILPYHSCQVFKKVRCEMFSKFRTLRCTVHAVDVLLSQFDFWLKTAF
jgi:hypothetical protein